MPTPGRAGAQQAAPLPWLRVEVGARMECGLLDFWQDDSLLGLVFAFFVFVGDFALLV
jgi:hypothetical protein